MSGLRSRLILAVFVAGGLVGFAGQASASSNGITGLTADAVTGCNACHALGTFPTVTLSGPTTVMPGATNQYLLEVFDIGAQHKGGLDAAASGGTLSVGGSHSSGTQLAFNEITHTAAKASDGTSVKFSFLWTAPIAGGAFTLRAWGNAVNGNGTNSGDAATFASLAVDVATIPTHDAVVLPVTARNITLSATQLLGITKKLSVPVRNADPVGVPPQTIELTLTDTTCPPGVTFDPADFNAKMMGFQESVVLAPGKTKSAKVAVTVLPTAFTTLNRKSPNRCHATFSAGFPLEPGNVEPSPTNNTIVVEINVIDKSDPQVAAVQETVLRSIAPLSLTIPLNKASVIKKKAATVINADILPLPSPGHVISLAADLSSCPWLSVAPIDFVPAPPALDTAMPKGGKSATAKLAITADAALLSTPNLKAPLRCVATVTATGPLDPDNEPSNNSSQLVIDVLDKNVP
jgi:hypothetical protein